MEHSESAERKGKAGPVIWLVISLVLIIGGMVVVGGVKNPQYALMRHVSSGGYIGELGRQVAASGDINKGAFMLAVGWGVAALGVLIATLSLLALRRRSKVS